MSTILYLRGDQTIRFAPVDRNGRPRRVTAATYQIVDLREVEGVDRHVVVAETAAGIPATTTTTTAAAGPSTADPRRLSLTSVAGFRTEGTYVVEDAGSDRSEAVRVLSVDASALELTSTNGLVRNYATGSGITAIELEGTFPGIVADDEQRLQSGGGPFQVTWVYTLDEQLYVVPQVLWLTRYGIQPWVTPAEVFRHLPGHAQQVGESVTPEGAIAAATDDLVEHLQAGGSWRRDPAYFRGSLSASLAVRKWALMYMLRGSRSESALDLADRYEAKALLHANNLTEGVPSVRSAAVDPANETATAGGERLRVGGIFSRS